MKTLTTVLILFSLPLLLFSCKNKEEKKDKPAGPAKINTSSVNKDKMANPYSPVDISPMDMCYYPTNYPILKMDNAITDPPLARVIYSRPHLEGRQLFHDILKYGEPWRLGANEATELQLYKDATIQDKKIKAGRYVIYCIPQPEKWTIHLNSNIDSWGLKPDSTKDIARFEIRSQTTDHHLEYYTMIFEKNDTGAQLLMAWDNVEARLPIHF